MATHGMRFPLELGVAVGPDVFAASWRLEHWQTTLSSGPTADAIHAAAGEIRRRIGAKQRTSVTVAILPPLARVRRIELPRMSETDRQLAVTANASRYFFGIGDSPVCGTAVIHGRSRGGQRPMLVFSVSSGLVESITIGLEAEGLTVDRLVPAQTA